MSAVSLCVMPGTEIFGSLGWGSQFKRAQFNSASGLLLASRAGASVRYSRKGRQLHTHQHTRWVESASFTCHQWLMAKQGHEFPPPAGVLPQGQEASTSLLRVSWGPTDKGPTQAGKPLSRSHQLTLQGWVPHCLAQLPLTPASLPPPASLRHSRS